MMRGVTLKMLLPCLAAMLMLSAAITPANTHAASETDWWPMFHHDLAHRIPNLDSA
jgi:hypothetical protein